MNNSKILLIAKSRNICKWNMFWSIPCGLFYVHLVKTSKVKLLPAVEEEIEGETVSELPATAEKAMILDAMAMLQTLAPIPRTFGELKAVARSLKGVEVFFTHEEKCHCFIKWNEQFTYTEVDELSCDQSWGSRHKDDSSCKRCLPCTPSYIIIRSPDTDGFFIALNACLDINASTYFETGTGHGRRITALNNIRQRSGDQHGVDLC